MEQKCSKNEKLKNAITAELKELKGEDKDKKEIEEMEAIQKEEVDLEFILEVEGEHCKKQDEIESIIQREIFKTPL